MTSKEFEDLFEKGLEAGRRRKYSDAVEIFSQLSTTDDPRPLLLLGRSWHGLGDYSRAVQVFQSYLRQFDPTPEACFFLGRSLLALGLPQKAVHFLERARKDGWNAAQLWGLLGSAYLKARNSEKAVEVLEQAVGLNQGNRGVFIAYMNALMVRAIQLFHRGDYDLCRQMLDFLIQNGAESSLLHRYLAAAWRELGHPEKTLVHLKKARQDSEEDPVLVFQTVEALFQTGDTQTARAELQKVRHLLPEGMTSISGASLEELWPYHYLRQGKYRKAVFYALKNMKVQPENGPMALILGESYRQLGDLEKAEAHFTRARKFLKTQSEPDYGLIMVHWQKKSYEEAFKESQRLLKTHPTDETIGYYHALLRCKLDLPPEENLEILRELIRRSEPDPFLFSALAGEYHKLSLDDLALPWLQRTLSVDPEHEEAMTLFGQVLVKAEVPDWKKFFREYMLLRPNDSEVQRTFIHKLLEDKDYKEAQKQLLDWMARGHRNESSLRALGFTHRMLNQFQSAFLVYRDLLHSHPQNPEYISAVVLCLFKTGRKELAIEFSKRALGQGAENAKLHYQIGLIAFASEDWDEAVRAFNKVLEIQTNHWQSVQKLAEIYEKRGDVIMSKRYRSHAEKMRLLQTGKK